MSTIWDEALDGQSFERDIGSVTCERCGKRGLVLIDTGARWVLFEDGGRKHVCANDDLLAQSDFLDLDA